MVFLRTRDPIGFASHTDSLSSPPESWSRTLSIERMMHLARRLLSRLKVRLPAAEFERARQRATHLRHPVGSRLPPGLGRDGGAEREYRMHVARCLGRREAAAGSSTTKEAAPGRCSGGSASRGGAGETQESAEGWPKAVRRRLGRDYWFSSGFSSSNERSPEAVEPSESDATQVFGLASVGNETKNAPLCTVAA
jgi:hypothetical protein